MDCYVIPLFFFCVKLLKNRFRHVKTWHVLLVVVGVECVGDLQLLLLLLVLAPLLHLPTFKVRALQQPSLSL